MSSADTAVTRTAPAGRRATSPVLTAEAVADWEAARSRWARLAVHGTALAFQQTPWLDAWYRQCLGSGSPLIVFIRDADGTRDLLALPLVVTREGRKRVIGFADGGLTDYNAPALAGDSGITLEGARLWRALRSALPRADLLRFEKMPETILGRPNPLASMPGVAASSLIGNILHVPGTWDEWHWALERTFRKELERSGRVFEKHPGATFRRYEAGSEADQIYAELKRMQAARIAELGLPYILDDEPARGFYDALVRDGLRDGTAVLTALTIGDEVVAALLGITDGRHFAMTRLATPDARHKNFSPGRMIIERTMKMLHGEGFRAFDFTIGDYSYKRRIGVTPVPMVELTRALSPIGWPEIVGVAAKAAIKRHPGLLAAVRRLRGTKPEQVSH